MNDEKDQIIKDSEPFLALSHQIGRTLVQATQDDVSLTLYFDGGNDPRQAKGRWKLQILADKMVLNCCDIERDR